MENTETQEPPTQDSAVADSVSEQRGARLDTGVMACPVCGHEMPDLKGGKATICPECGFKDSCCY
jgi:membrane protease subunit (stomatin/prohibitin family)